MEIVDLEKVRYEFHDNGLTYITLKKDQHLEIEDSLQEYEMLMNRPEKLPLVAVVTTEDFATVSGESRRFWLNGKGTSLLKAEAIVSQNLGPKIMFLLVKKTMNFKVQLKMFSKKSEAEQWALQQLD